MLDKSKTYLIVGLGLLGGRYAQVLSSHGYHVTGIARSRETIDYALPRVRPRTLTRWLPARIASSLVCTLLFCWSGSSSTGI